MGWQIYIYFSRGDDDREALYSDIMSNNHSSDLDLVQPWRKTFPLTRPPIPKNTADAERFVREFEEACDEIDLGNGWTMGDVARGEHDGGLSPNHQGRWGGKAWMGADGYPSEQRLRTEAR